MEVKNVYDYTLDREIESPGNWWFPGGSIEDSVAGVMMYSIYEIELELTGELIGTKESFESYQRDGFHSFIHGSLENGIPCTLVRVHPGGLKHNPAGGPPRVKYSASYVLVGVHANEPLLFDKVELFSPLLDAFTSRDNFDSDFPIQSDPTDSTAACIRYSNPKEYSFSVPSHEMTFTLAPRWVITEKQASATLATAERVRLNPQSPQRLEWCLQQVWHACDLFSLLTNDDASLSQIVCHWNGKQASLLCLNRLSIQFGKPQSPLLFYLKHIESDFQAVLEKWYSVSDTLLTSIHLFIHALRLADRYVDSRFITLAQAIETFSRASGHGEYMTREEYDDIKQTLIRTIPSSVESGHRESLKSKISFGYEYSLRKRLSVLLRSLSEEALSLVCDSRSTFESQFANTRNYLTHYTDELKEEALQGADLWLACEKVLMLMRILLLKEMGVDEELACQRIRLICRSEFHRNRSEHLSRRTN